MSIVAGWYTDPAQQGNVRWWDGFAWTETTQADPRRAILPPPRAEHRIPEPAFAAPSPGYVGGASTAHPDYDRFASAPYPVLTPRTGPAPYGAPAPITPDAEPWSPINLLVPSGPSLPIRALVWGAVSIPLFIGILPGIMAILFGAGGLARDKSLRARGQFPPGRTESIMGIVLGSVSLLAFIGLVVLGILSAR